MRERNHMALRVVAAGKAVLPGFACSVRFEQFLAVRGRFHFSPQRRCTGMHKMHMAAHTLWANGWECGALIPVPSVAIVPGAMALQRMPSLPSSRAMDCVRLIRPDREGERERISEGDTQTQRESLRESARERAR